MSPPSWSWVLAFAVLAGCLQGGLPVEGEDGGGAGDDVAKALALDGVEWRAHAAAPTARTEVLAARSGNEVVVVGGYAGPFTASSLVEVYDVDADAWSRAPPYPIVIHHAAPVVHDGTVYVFGGYTSSLFVPTDLVFRLDAASGAWVLATRLPTPRGAHGAALVGDHVVLVGGVGPDGDLTTAVHVYDLVNGTWSEAAPLPTARDHLSVAAVDGVVYAAGGRLQTLTSNLATLEAYDPVSDVWETRAEMPTARGGTATATWRGHLLVLGGEASDKTFPEVEAYDPASDTWRDLPDLPTPRHGFAAVTVDDRVYTFLGGPEPSFTASAVVESLGVADA